MLELPPADLEQKLVQQARQGSRAAFVELVELFHGLIRKRIARFVGNPASVDDVAQEVFLAAFDGLHRYDGSGPFAGWLLGIARNKAISHLRSEAKRRENANQTLDAEMLQWRANEIEATPIEAMEEDELQQNLQACLRELAPSCRRLVQSYYFEKRSAQEIAATEKRKAGTIRMALMRIRRGLKECIQHKQAGKGEQDG